VRRLLDRTARALARILVAVFFRSAEVQGSSACPRAVRCCSSPTTATR
jgi:hypothetical protein